MFAKMFCGRKREKKILKLFELNTAKWNFLEKNQYEADDEM